VRWAALNVRRHDAGKHFEHPVVGELKLSHEALPLPADPGLNLITYTAETDSRSEQALGLLAAGPR
jgi:hypothetical protein